MRWIALCVDWWFAPRGGIKTARILRANLDRGQRPASGCNRSAIGLVAGLRPVGEALEAQQSPLVPSCRSTRAADPSLVVRPAPPVPLVTSCGRQGEFAERWDWLKFESDVGSLTPLLVRSLFHAHFSGN